MLRIIVLVIVIFFSGASSASESPQFYKDWRLDKPFVHGFFVGISFGIIESQPEQWGLAGALEPSGIPSGMLPYILKHKVIPFRIGLFSALGFWLYLFVSVAYRYLNRRLYMQYISKVLMEKDDEYRKKLLSNIE